MIVISMLPLLKPCAGSLCGIMKCLCKVSVERLLEVGNSNSSDMKHLCILRQLGWCSYNAG